MTEPTQALHLRAAADQLRAVMRWMDEAADTLDVQQSRHPGHTDATQPHEPSERGAAERTGEKGGGLVSSAAAAGDLAQRAATPAELAAIGTAMAAAEQRHTITAWGRVDDRVDDRANAAQAERDGAYRERAQLLAWLAATVPAVIAPAPDVDESGWQLLYLDTPQGQLSWHIHPRDSELFAHVEHVTTDDPRARWDGHNTDEKYDRIRSLVGEAW